MINISGQNPASGVSVESATVYLALNVRTNCRRTQTALSGEIKTHLQIHPITLATVLIHPPPTTHHLAPSIIHLPLSPVSTNPHLAWPVYYSSFFYYPPITSSSPSPIPLSLYTLPSPPLVLKQGFHPKPILFHPQILLNPLSTSSKLFVTLINVLFKNLNCFWRFWIVFLFLLNLTFFSLTVCFISNFWTTIISQGIFIIVLPIKMLWPVLEVCLSKKICW